MTDVVTRFVIDASGAATGATRISEAVAAIDKALTTVDASAKRTQATLNTAFAGGGGGIAALAAEISRLASAMASVRTPPGLATMQAELNRVSVTANEAAAAMGKLELATAKAISGQLAANAASAETSMARMNTTMKGSNELLKAMAYLVSAIAFKDLATGVFEASMQFTKFQVQLGATFKGTQEVNDEMALVQRTSLTLGTNMNSAMEGFSRFATSAKLSGASIQEINDIFVNMSETISVFQLSASETQGIWLALEQVFNKGSLQMQELKLQLGNDLPGAFETMAKSLNVSTQDLGKLMAAGKVSSESLVHFAQVYRDTVAGQLPAATRTAQAEVNKLGSAWEIFLNQIGKSGAMDALAAGLHSITASIIDMDALGNGVVRLTPKFQALATQASDTFTQIINKGKVVVGFITDHFQEIVTVLEIAFGAKMLMMVSNFFGGIVTGIPALLGLSKGLVEVGAVGRVAAGILGENSGGLLGILGRLIGAIPLFARGLAALALANPVLAAITIAVGAVGFAWAALSDKQKKATDEGKHSVTTYSQSVIGDLTQVQYFVDGHLKTMQRSMTDADREYMASLHGRTVAEEEELRSRFLNAEKLTEEDEKVRNQMLGNMYTRELLESQKAAKDKLAAQEEGQAEEVSGFEAFATKLESAFNRLNSDIAKVWNGFWQGLADIAKGFFDKIMGWINTALAALNKGNKAASGVEGRASGGPMSANRPYIVGENGPEMVVPQHDSTVIPAGATGKLLSGGMRGYASGGTMPAGVAGIVGEQGPELMYSGGQSSAAHVMQADDVAKFARQINTTPTFRPAPNNDASFVGFNGKPSHATLEDAMRRFTETMDTAVKTGGLSKKGENFSEMVLGLAVADWDKYLTKGPSKDSANGISPYFKDVNAAVSTYPWVGEYVAGAFGTPFANDALHPNSTSMASVGRNNLISVTEQQAAYKKAYDEYVKANLVRYDEFAYNFAAGESGMAGLYINSADIVPFDTSPFESFSDFTNGQFPDSLQPKVGNMFYMGLGDNVGTSYARIADGGATGGKTTNWSEGGFSTSNVDASGGFDSKTIEENNKDYNDRQAAMSDKALGITHSYFHYEQAATYDENGNYLGTTGVYVDQNGKDSQGRSSWTGTVDSFNADQRSTATGFERGGSAEVGGVGGVDSQLVQFRATPGELINVTRPQDQERDERTSKRNNGSPLTINFHVMTPDANSFKRSQKQIMQKLNTQIRQATKDQ